MALEPRRARVVALDLLALVDDGRVLLARRALERASGRRSRPAFGASGTALSSAIASSLLMPFWSVYSPGRRLPRLAVDRGAELEEPRRVDDARVGEDLADLAGVGVLGDRDGDVALAVAVERLEGRVGDVQQRRGGSRARSRRRSGGPSGRCPCRGRRSRAAASCGAGAGRWARGACAAARHGGRGARRRGRSGLAGGGSTPPRRRTRRARRGRGAAAAGDDLGSPACGSPSGASCSSVWKRRVLDRRLVQILARRDVAARGLRRRLEPRLGRLLVRRVSARRVARAAARRAAPRAALRRAAPRAAPRRAAPRAAPRRAVLTRLSTRVLGGASTRGSVDRRVRRTRGSARRGLARGSAARRLVARLLARRLARGGSGSTTRRLRLVDRLRLGDRRARLRRPAGGRCPRTPRAAAGDPRGGQRVQPRRGRGPLGCGLVRALAEHVQSGSGPARRADSRGRQGQRPWAC